MATRQQAFAAIERERDHQDSKWDGETSIGESILLMESYLVQARETWRGERAPETITLDLIRQITAMGIRCMEQHGVVERKP